MTTAPESLGAVVLDMIHQAVRCMERIQHEKDCIEELRRLAADELAVDPKDFNALVKQYS